MEEIDRHRVLDQLQKHEGYRKKPYRDSLNKLTVGFGHLIEHPCKISLDTLKFLCNGEVRKAWEHQLLVDMETAHAGARLAAEANMVNFDVLSNVRREALIQMAFQLGEYGLRMFKNMWKSIRVESWKSAAEHAVNSRWNDQTPNRAEFVYHLLRYNKYPGEETKHA